MTLVETRPADDLEARLRALDEVARLGEGRLDPAGLAEVRAVVERAGKRRGLSTQHTVVALAGATGTGKSSLFNALSGLELSPAGPLRPTTVRTLSCVWGPVSADPVLDWLEIPARDRIARETVLDAKTQAALHGLVLLDLPDNDSTQAAHRHEVDRLVGLVDLLVWVMDPQKYADQLLHERYLRKLSGHQDTMLVLLNQADTLPDDAVGMCLDDLRRLLAADGLADVPLLATSARTGQGLSELRDALATRVSARDAGNTRLREDVVDVAGRLLAACPGTPPESPGPASAQSLTVALSEAVAVPELAEAVERHVWVAVSDVTRWPPARWAESLSADPLGRYDPDGTLRDAAWAEPRPWPAERARVDAALHEVADSVSGSFDGSWRALARRVLTSRREQVAEALDHAVSGVDLGLRIPSGVKALGRFQWLFLLAALGGLAWLLTLGVLAFVPVEEPTPPGIGILPVPVALVLLGAGGGMVVSAVSAIAVRRLSSRRRDTAASALHAAVAEVADQTVMQPLARETQVMRDLCAALTLARDGASEGVESRPQPVPVSTSDAG